MAINSRSVLAALCATTILTTGAACLTTGAAWAAATTPTKKAKATPQQAVADKDLDKFSAAGAAAFADIALTRRAIFEGSTSAATLPIEVWPVPDLQDAPRSGAAARQHLDALERLITERAIENSQFKAILNEKDPPPGRLGG